MADKRDKAYEVRPLSWVFYMIILPIVFTIVLLIVILQFILGFNVTGTFNTWLDQFPVVRHTLGLPAKMPPVSEQVLSLKTQLKLTVTNDRLHLKTLEVSVHHLQQQLATSKTTASVLKNELHSVQRQLIVAKQVSKNAKSEATVLMNMSPTQASQILVLLPFPEQVLTLQAMDAPDQASVMAQLPVKVAAKLLQSGA